LTAAVFTQVVDGKPSRIIVLVASLRIRSGSRFVCSDINYIALRADGGDSWKDTPKRLFGAENLLWGNNDF
jgi:hypothetical protein